MDFLIPNQDFIVKWLNSDCVELPALKNHTSALYKNFLLMFGGYDGENHLNNLYLYDLINDCSRLQVTTGDIPKGRNGHTSTVWNSKMIIIGGWLGTGQYASNEIYELDLEKFIWKKLLPDPGVGPSNMHSADLYIDEIYIFRGGDGRGYFNDLIVYNILNNKCKLLETTGKMPHVRANHASKIIGKNLFIFGGWSGNKRLNDLYSINLEKLQWNNIEIQGNKPTPRAGTPLVNYNDYLIIFGGSGANSLYLNDLYFLDINNKIWFIPNKVDNYDNFPCERAGHTAVINDRYLYIFGGGSNSSSSLKGMHILEIDPEPKFNIKLNAKDKMYYNFKKFFNDPFLSDVTLIINQNESIFYGHKFILSLLCEKFKAMFSFDFEESINQVVRIKYKFKHFEIILKYLYSGEIINSNRDFNLLDYFELMKISDEHLLEDIKDWCQSEIAKLINSSNFFLISQFSKKYSADYLIKYCSWYYRQNRQSIMLSSVEFSLSDLTIWSNLENDNSGI